MPALTPAGLLRMLSRFRLLLLTALAPVLWGTTYSVASSFLPPGQPLVTATMRTLPAGILLLLASRLPLFRPSSGPAARRQESGARLAGGDVWRLVILSFLNIGLFQALLFVAADRLPGGMAAVLGAIQPLLVIALAWGIDGQKPVVPAVVASMTAVAGMAALVLSAPAADSDPYGVVAALGGAASMAAGTFLSRRWSHRWQGRLTVLSSTGWQVLAGGLMLLPLAVHSSGGARAALPEFPGVPALLAYAWLSLAGTLLAYLLWFRGLAGLSPLAVSSLGLLSPLTAVVLGWGFLGQTLTPLSLAGLVVVLGSIVAVQRVVHAPVAGCR